MASRGLQGQALFLYALCEGCSREAAELSAACTITLSMLPTDLNSSGLITQCAHMIRRCRAGGRRQA
eukprot:7388013-Prymnesium_polylepis.1